MTTLLNQPWTERLGWTLLHFLWQGILVAALYALARALAGDRISARGRYAIACASLLAMTVAPALTYWWLGNSGQAAPIGNLTDWGARQLSSGVTYSLVTDPWQQAMPGIVMAWFAGAAICSLRPLMGFISAAIDDDLPPRINLQEPVDGTITVGGLTNVVYVGRPVFGRSNSQVTLFKLEPDGHSAKRVPVQIGAASVNLIEIKDGLQPGDKVIISDMSKYDGVGVIALR